jgi:hypothetical protein
MMIARKKEPGLGKPRAQVRAKVEIQFSVVCWTIFCIDTRRGLLQGTATLIGALCNAPPLSAPLRKELRL